MIVVKLIYNLFATWYLHFKWMVSVLQSGHVALFYLINAKLHSSYIYVKT
ncbi:hypothetical protein C7424_0461 [Pantoea ananatis]|nr:hypothetical protein C7424_0461 [Pantoea ananatis]